MLSEAAYDFDTGCTAGRLERVDWIDRGNAVDLVFEPSEQFDLSQCASLASAIRQRVLDVEDGVFKRDVPLDVIVQPAANRRKRLLVADMDSTMIGQECIDELADFVGRKAEVAAVTEAAMRGELDFAEALDARVALLKGLEDSAIDRCRAERVSLMPGARTLVRTMAAHGAHTLLVSGGFTRFAGPVAAEIGFAEVRANVLGIEGEKLTGLVAKPIVDAEAKRRALEETASAHGIPLAEAMAVGDGANDIPMVRAAGLGVAYHAKPALAAAADARIDTNDLTALLYAQGYARSEWIEA